MSEEILETEQIVSLIDWPEIVGSALALVFCLLVLVPLVQLQSENSSQEKGAGNYMESRAAKHATINSEVENGWWQKLQTDPLATFTAALAFVTTGLVAAGVWQSSLTKRSVDLARDEFNASHRPIIQVRNVALANELEFAKLGLGDHVKGRVSVTNIGDTTANVVASHLFLYWSDSGLPPDPPYTGRTANNFCGNREIEAGGSIRATFSETIVIPNKNTTGTFECVGPGGETPIAARKFRPGPSSVLYVMGWIEFRDGRNVNRQIGFCRWYDQPNKRFSPIDNPDYEYKA